MRIGVDATCWANGRGYGRFAREMLRAMVALAPDDEFICFLDPLSADRFDLRAPNVRAVRVAGIVPPAVAAAADGSRSAVDMLRLSRAVGRERPDARRRDREAVAGWRERLDGHGLVSVP